ncbi:MAG: hypothetical protein KJO21_01595 [Verrucomicrobiae bacterium]|nr:hypothetical protein [Verrucomicrobiae bacterium]NNJ42229.1 hypothetical protein [Akkermansiaceae bacterium]
MSHALAHAQRFFQKACILFLCCGATISAASPRTTIEANWVQQEKTTFSRNLADPAALKDLLQRGHLMIADMKDLGVNTQKTETTLAAIQSQLAHPTPDLAPLYKKARWAIRQLAFSNPLLDFDQLLFVKRNTPYYQHQCGHRVGEAQLPGSNLCILSGLKPDGKVTDLLKGPFANGGIGRPDLSFDAKRIVFPYARKRENGTPFTSGTYGGDGLCDPYDLYEIGTDGTGIHQVTQHPTAEDTEPCYLPGNRIAFTSSRNNRLVQCGDWALVNGIFSVQPDGNDLYKITEPQDGEFYPSLLEDGRILYTRWDYVMKPYNTQQQLWTVNPDGRRAELAYGDYYTFSRGPIALFEARQIPGTAKVIATGAAHHNNCAGPIMIVDMDQNRGGPKGMKKITPEVHYPEVAGSSGGHKRKSTTGWFRSPYPLGEHHYLVTYSFGPDTVSNYGIYLMDVHGNKELIYQTNSKLSCYAPIPLRPRKTPHVIPNLVKNVDPDTPATIMVNDVYQGLLREGVKRGEVKHLRIIEVLTKKQHTQPRRCDVGVNSGWDIRKVLGTVPIENDGSAHFQLPPHKLLLFEALDNDHLEIKRMRNYLNVKPGESVSCIGCHEPYGMAPPNRKQPPLASLRPPSPITPPPWGVRGMSFKHIIQPILDKHCTSCHDGSTAPQKSFNLHGSTMVVAPKPYDADEGPQHAVSQSFLNLINYVSFTQVGGYGNHNPKTLVPTQAKTTGSHASSLMKTLKTGHHNVQLPQDEWRAFAAWIDCNAPYYGDFQEIITIKDLAPPSDPSTPPSPQRSFAVTDLRRNEALIIRNGKILWSYPMHAATEIKAYPDGAYLISGQNQVVMVDRAKHTRFQFTGDDLFSTERMPNGNFLINDNTSHSLIELTPTGQEVKRTPTTIKNSKVSKHHHALHFQLLANGNRWVAHRDNQFARKYDPHGKILRTLHMPCSVTSVQELANGNVLIAGGQPARLSEFDPHGKEIWSLTANDVPTAHLMTICGFQRLPNGNTILTNWTGHHFKGKYLPIIEVNKKKKIVWSFSDTALTPEPISIQVL